MIEQTIIKVFCSNFVAYYKAHSSHWNTTGRNFYSDHKLLNKIYEDLQDEIDTLAEIIRTLDIFAPAALTEIIADSNISDIPVFDDQDGDEYLKAVKDDLEQLVLDYQDLEQTAKDLQHNHVSNYCQDRVRTLEKFIWMIRSTLINRD
jgi:starvation-inducible DNA-binding protein